MHSHSLSARPISELARAWLPRHRRCCGEVGASRTNSESAKRFFRILTTGLNPFDELRHVHPAIAGLAVVNPGLGLLQARAELVSKRNVILHELGRLEFEFSLANRVATPYDGQVIIFRYGCMDEGLNAIDR